jgi:oligopeptidase B
LETEEQVILDVNELARGHSFCDVGEFDTSPSSNLLAFTVDFEGNESYTVRFKSLSPDVVAPTEELTHVNGSLSFGCDDRVVFYTTHNKEWRSDKVWKHVLGTPQSEDELVMHEKDALFSVGVFRTRSDRLLVVESGSIETTEAWVLDLDDPAIDGGVKPIKPHLKCVSPREKGWRYDVNHRGDAVLIVHNGGGKKKNGEFAWAPLEAPQRKNWKTLVPYDPAVQVKYVTAFANHLVVVGRQDGSQQLWLANGEDVDAAMRSDGTNCPVLVRIPTAEDVYSLSMGFNEEYDTDRLRFRYSSFLTPSRDYELHVPKALATVSMGTSTHRVVRNLEVGVDSALVVLREKPAPNVDLSAYASRRIYCPVPRDPKGSKSDVVFVPISLLWRPDCHASTGAVASPASHLPENQAEAVAIGASPVAAAPVLLYGYGSYGISIDPRFESHLFSLLDRGVVYAVAHIRGGGEMGRPWYEDYGKFLTKQNTFSDFVACAQFLSSMGWADPKRIGILGRSAGGLLVGRSLTLRPDLWACAVADVPFVDLMTTMCDESIPLTTGEWEEWGDPRKREFFDYMLQYSPMDTAAKAKYPPVLLSAGLHDPRVQYWEPAKFAQRLRDAALPGSGDVLLKTDMSSGHFSASDRYRYIEETSFELAFILDKLGVVV